MVKIHSFSNKKLSNKDFRQRTHLSQSHGHWLNPSAAVESLELVRNQMEAWVVEWHFSDYSEIQG